MFEAMRIGTRVLRQEHGDAVYCVTSMQREIGQYSTDHLVAALRIDNPENPLVAGAIPDSHIALSKKAMDISLVSHMGGLDYVLDECEAEAKRLLAEKDEKIERLTKENELRIKQVEVIRRAVVSLTNESDKYFLEARELRAEVELLRSESKKTCADQAGTNNPLADGKFKVDAEEPYEEEIVFTDRDGKAHRIAKIYLDDAPVHDYNAIQRRLAYALVDSGNRVIMERGKEGL